MQKLTKDEIYSLANFMKQGFMTHDVCFFDTYLTFKSLTKFDREVIHSKYKYLSSKFNMILVLDILSKTIYKIGGIVLEEKKVRKVLSNSSSKIMTQFYEHYSEAEKQFDSLLEKIEDFSKTSESRNLWQISKANLADLNEHQNFWALLNVSKDKLEHAKFEWSKVEYMTNSICAFLNPKEFKRLKEQMNITDKFEDEELIEEEFEGKDSDIEKGAVDLNKQVVNQLVRKEGESKQDYFDRVSASMIEMNKGKVLDEHDQKVRDYEFSVLRKMLLERKIKSETTALFRKAQEYSKVENMNLALSSDGIYHEEASTIGEESFDQKVAAEVKSEGFFHEGISYADIVRDKFFGSIPKDEKIRYFEAVMAEKLDIESHIAKNASPEQKEQLEQIKEQMPLDTITSKPEVIQEPLVVSSKEPDVVSKEEYVFDESEAEFLAREAAAWKTAHMDIKDTKVVKSNVEKANKQIVKKDLNVDSDIDQIII